jgi:ADP-ribose pyrophosphatase YjhB (NUDIX family)
MTSQDSYLRGLAASRSIRSTVRSIIIHEDRLLVQQPSDAPDSCYAFIGGGVAFGELIEDRLRAEMAEELGASVSSARYLFFVENRFEHAGELVHLHEHFFLVHLTDYEISSHHPGLIQRWIPIRDLGGVDIRPHVVRDAVIRGQYMDVRHLVVML